jgi:hypothetical protein
MLSENIAQFIPENNELFHVWLGNRILFFFLLDSKHIIEGKGTWKEGIVEFPFIRIRIIDILDTFYSLHELSVSYKVILLKFLIHYFNSICSRRSFLFSWRLSLTCSTRSHSGISLRLF